MAKILDLTMLSDIFPTGFHGAVTAGFESGRPSTSPASSDHTTSPRVGMLDHRCAAAHGIEGLVAAGADQSWRVGTPVEIFAAERQLVQHRYGVA